jgi:hypothetical protein
MDHVELFIGDKPGYSAGRKKVEFSSHPGRVDGYAYGPRAFAEHTFRLGRQFRAMTAFLQTFKKIVHLLFTAAPSQLIVYME